MAVRTAPACRWRGCTGRSRRLSHSAAFLAEHVRGSSDTTIAPRHPNASCARIWTARGVYPAMVAARTATAGGRVTTPGGEQAAALPPTPLKSSVPWPGRTHGPARLVAPGCLAANGIGSAPRSWPQYRNAQPAPKASGAGSSRAPAPGVRKRCMDRGLHALACPTSCMAG